MNQLRTLRKLAVLKHRKEIFKEVKVANFYLQIRLVDYLQNNENQTWYFALPSSATWYMKIISTVDDEMIITDITTMVQSSFLRTEKNTDERISNLYLST